MKNKLSLLAFTVLLACLVSPSVCVAQGPCFDLVGVPCDALVVAGPACGDKLCFFERGDDWHWDWFCNHNTAGDETGELLHPGGPVQMVDRLFPPPYSQQRINWADDYVCKSRVPCRCMDEPDPDLPAHTCEIDAVELLMNGQETLESFPNISTDPGGVMVWCGVPGL